MFCKNCGKGISEMQEVCLNCGVRKGDGDKYCPNCGVGTNPKQEICIKCGMKLNPATGVSFSGNRKKKFVRSREGKIIGGVCAGAEKCFGINRWISRLVLLFIPLWVVWFIAYIIICATTEQR